MKRLFSVVLVITCVLLSGSLIACENVVPGAWVKLDMDGYVVYTSNMYASGGDHVYLYDDEETAKDDKHHANYNMAIVFFPRILGADTINDERTTIVDISSWYSMTIYINKGKEIYEEGKKIYLNDEELTASHVDDLDVLLCLTFEDFTFLRGNPNGQLNNVINRIEYKYSGCPRAGRCCTGGCGRR